MDDTWSVEAPGSARALEARPPEPRHVTAEALLDATERLLIDVGYAALSIRKITDEAGQAHGSIRYHFGTLENLIVAVVDRQTDRIASRQRAMYESDEPFSAKWRQAMTWFDEDLASGYPKLVAELGAAAWNLPACRPGHRRTVERWATMLRDAVADAVHELDLDVDAATIAGVAGLIRTSQQAMLEDRLAGIDIDHEHIVALITRLIDDIERRASRPPDAERR
jgi:AcrR family transcriptional regulator